MILMEDQLELLLETCINEDLGNGDPTTQACIPEDSRCTGQIIIKQAGVIAGLPYFKRIFEKIDPQVVVTFFVPEGSYQKSGVVLGKIEGPTRSIISGERTALNLLQHASGIASHTAEYVRRIDGYDCAILDTRGTLPGMRHLEKYAIGVGGGVVRRNDLGERLIIKINHLRFLGSERKRPIREAFEKVQKAHPDLPIDIEIDDIAQLAEAMSTDAHAIVLRGMFPHDVEHCVRTIHPTNKRVFVDCGSTITLDTIRSYADTGVDGIAIGTLSHASQSLDIVIRLTK